MYLRRCKALVYVQDVSALLPYVVWAGVSILGSFHASPFSDFRTRFAVFSTYRGYALSGRKGHVAAIIFTLTLVPIGVNMVRWTLVACLTARATYLAWTVLLRVHAAYQLPAPDRVHNEHRDI